MALALSPDSPKRTQAEPGKRRGKEHRDSGAAWPHLACVIFRIFLPRGAAEAKSHDEKDDSGHLEPQLVHNVTEGARRRADRAHDGAERAASSGLLAGNPRHRSHFAPGGNFAHDLDFNSLQRYNDATLRSSEPFFCLGHLTERAFMQTSTPDLDQLKSRMKATWMAGDFGQIANYSAREAENFVGRIGIASGAKVLDVACGTGNTAIPAARSGASVTGVDIATNLLEQAKKRAESEKLKVHFQEGDAEDLPFLDHSFDVVSTMFGAMFAPRPEKVAAELVRVCKPGGVIAMANWTPEGFVGKSFQITAKMVPPPPVPPPVLWGEESVVRQRLGNGTKHITCTRQHVHFVYPFPPREIVDLFRKYFGPTQMAFSRLDEAGQKSLAVQTESLWAEHNTATDGTTAVKAEYLDVRAIRA